MICFASVFRAGFRVYGGKDSVGKVKRLFPEAQFRVGLLCLAFLFVTLLLDHERVSSAAQERSCDEGTLKHSNLMLKSRIPPHWIQI